MIDAGAYTDEAGTLRCRASDNRCLGHRQALELVDRARGRGESAKAVHCPRCSAWHYHKVGRLKGRPPHLPRRQTRRWRMS